MHKISPEERIKSILLHRNWNITEIKMLPFRTGCGLLNDPVLKYIIKHDGEITRVAVKIVNREPRLLFRSLYSEYGHATERQLELFDDCCHFLSMNRMPERERLFYQSKNKKLNSYTPCVYGVEGKGQCLFLVMEDLSYCSCLDEIEMPERWSREDIDIVMQTLALFHHLKLAPDESFSFYAGNGTGRMTAQFIEEFHYNISRNIITEQIEQVSAASWDYVCHLESFEKCLEQYRKILIHNDFNIRNICIDRKSRTLKVYDWEFIDYKNPIMDLTDFFLSLSSDYLIKPNLDRWLCEYMNCSSVYGETDMTISALKEQLYYNTVKFSATRMNMYLLFYGKRKSSYIDRMYMNIYHLMLYCMDK